MLLYSWHRATFGYGIGLNSFETNVTIKTAAVPMGFITPVLRDSYASLR